MRHDFGFGQADTLGNSNISPDVFAKEVGERTLARGRLKTGRHQHRVHLFSISERFWFSALQALAILVSSVVAGVAYHEIFLGVRGSVPGFLAVGMAAGILYAAGSYIVDGTARLRNPSGREAMRDASLLWVGAFLLIAFVIFSLKASTALSRGAILSFFVVGYCAILLTRSAVPALLAARRKSATRAYEEILVIGVGGNPALTSLLSQLMDSGYETPAVIELNANCSDTEWEAELPILLGKIYKSARVNAHGDICVVSGGLADTRLRDITDAVRVIPCAVRVVPAPSIEALLHLPIRSIGELYSVELQRTPMNIVQRVIKRGIDLTISIPLMIFMSPLLAAIAIAIKLDSKGPVLFRQQRLGYRSQPFLISKFRTMTTLEDGAEVTQAAKNDARVTGIGRLLRKTSLDELPQLMNVLRGEMSLVGPRPHAVAHDRLYAKLIEHYEVRQHVKPGITGWAQVNGLRGETASVDLMRQRVEFDMWYAKNARIWLDIKILLLTVIEVLLQRGNAY